MAFDPNIVRRDYSDPALEAHACRTDCAVFDFSFIDSARLSGPRALDVIEQMTGRPLTGLPPGKIRYALREDSSCHLLSDLTVWRHGETQYEVMSGRSGDIADLVRAAEPACEIEDLSAGTSILAVQGPGSLRALGGWTDPSTLSELTYFSFARARIRGVACIIGRLGYTGEAGFEILLPRAAAMEIWDVLAQRARPAGFVAADMLRIEAGFVLFANEFRLPVTPREAGLARFGGAHGPPREPEIALVCFQASTQEKPMLWQPNGPIVRPSEPVTITITSACHSMQAGGTLGLGYARRSDVLAGTPLHDPTGAFADIRLAPLPLFDPQKRRPRMPWSEWQPALEQGACS